MMKEGVVRVISAAVVNKNFRDLLLTDPKNAIETGYLGEPFTLSDEETELLLSIRADTLRDLADQFLRSAGAE